MKDNFDGLISRLDIVDGRLYQLKDISIETLKTEKWREQRLNKIEQKTLQYINVSNDHVVHFKLIQC